jgi:uncharacterized protein YbbK (DUF523 family)
MDKAVDKQIKYLVSSCLIGKKCRYDGRDMARQTLVDLYHRGEVIDVCPEELGGLPTPRSPAERIGTQVISKEAKNLSHEYAEGAERALQLIANLPIEKAFLKSKSPMCGCGQIYDGSFTGKLMSGDGVFTELLRAKLKIPIEPID